MKDQNRVELLRSLYRAGQELHRAMEAWRRGDVHEERILRTSSVAISEDVVEAIVKVEQAVEAIAETGMFEPVSDKVAAQRLKDALAEPDDDTCPPKEALETVQRWCQLSEDERFAICDWLHTADNMGASELEPAHEALWILPVFLAMYQAAASKARS